MARLQNAKKFLAISLSLALLLITLNSLFTFSASAEGTESSHPAYFKVATDRDPIAQIGSVYGGETHNYYKVGDNATITVTLYDQYNQPFDSANGTYYVYHHMTADLKTDFNYTCQYSANTDPVTFTPSGNLNTDEHLPFFNQENTAYSGPMTFVVSTDAADQPGFYQLNLDLYTDSRIEFATRYFTDSANNTGVVEGVVGVGFNTEEINQPENTSVSQEDMNTFIRDNYIDFLGLDKTLTAADIVYKNEATEPGCTFDTYTSVEGEERNTADADTIARINAYEAYWLGEASKPGITVIKKLLTESDCNQYGIIYNGEYNTYDVKIETGEKRPVSAIITEPKNPVNGSLSIKMNYQGYGCYTLGNGGIEWSDSRVTVFVNNHGIPNALGKDGGSAMSEWAGPDEMGRLESNETLNSSTETSTYRSTVRRALRALQYCETLPEWNSREVISSGGSYGGFQCMSVAGIDAQRGRASTVTSVDAAVPWMCMVNSELDGYTNSTFRPTITSEDKDVKDAIVNTMKYYDTINYAKLISCKVNITLGLGDTICPPAGTLSLYHAILASGNCNDVVVLANQFYGHGGYSYQSMPEEVKVSYRYTLANEDENVTDVSRFEYARYGDGYAINAYHHPENAITSEEPYEATAKEHFELVTWTSGGTDYAEISPNGYAIKAYHPTAIVNGVSETVYDVKAPKEINGLKIAAIWDNAFATSADAENANITSVELPEGLLYTRNKVFNGASSLKTIIFPSSLKYIGTFSESMTALSDVYVYGSTTYVSGENGQETFPLDAFAFGLSNDSAITFHGYTGTTIESLVNDIQASKPNWVFEEAVKKDPNAVIVPRFINGLPVTNISSGAFTPNTTDKQYNVNITSLTFQEGVEDINFGGFSDCTNIEVLKFPATLKNLAGWNNNLKNIKIVYFYGKNTSVSETENINHIFGVGSKDLGDITFYGYSDSVVAEYSRMIFSDNNWGTFKLLDADSILRGDANDDGVVNVKDLVRAKKYLADTSTAINFYAMNLNNAKTIQADSLTGLKKMIMTGAAF